MRANEAIAPTETGTAKELMSLSRDIAFSDVFAAMDDLVTYHADAARKQVPIRLYMQLSRALIMDGIDVNAFRTAKQSILDKIDEELTQIKAAGEFERRASTITGFTVGTLTFEYSENAYTFDDATQTMTVSDFDIGRHFEQAGKLLCDSLHTEYWIMHSSRDILSRLIYIMRICIHSILSGYLHALTA